MSALIQKLGLWQGRASFIWLGVVLICLLMAFGAEDAREWGRYEREGLEGGEFWRLVTGHLVHLSWSHMWLNVAALGLLAAIFGDALSITRCVLVLLGAVVGIDAGLYLLQPEIAWYVGLSGVLHGVMAAGSLLLLVHEQAKFGLTLAAVLLGKLVFEQLFGPLPMTHSASGGPVIVAAHLYGAVGAALAVLPVVLSRYAARREL